MNALTSKEDLVFNYRTLRLIIGAVAFAFPTMVIALTGKITTSISASYHEVATRDVFVGLMFIIGALLISYKGHLQENTAIETDPLTRRFWGWLKMHQEDVISTIGGTAAIFTALNPTACDGCAIDPKARIHMLGAFLLFANVVYFCLIAFLRSLNQKLLGYIELRKNKAFMDRVKKLRKNKSRVDVNLLKRFWNFLTVELQIFLEIVAAEFRRYDKNNGFAKVLKVLKVHELKIARGLVYMLCGSLIALTLLAFLLLSLIVPRSLAQSTATFTVETISLVLFGIAWMTASKLEYISTIWKWWKGKSLETETIGEIGTA